MWQRRVRTGRKNSHGVASIKRDTYNSVNGFTQKNAWWDLRDEVWARDKGRCRAINGGKVCGAPGSEVHHITPLSRGGSNTKANLIVVCKPCHDKRHTHLFRSR